jgi:hypothetical protein
MMKRIIGGSDRIDFPELELENVEARIDTGAKSSSIRASYIKETEKDGKKILRFCLLGNRKKTYYFDQYWTREVKSSNGQKQKRFVVKLRVEIFGHRTLTDFTLARRKEMRYPVLLGRRLLRNRYVVDVSKKNLSYDQKKINKDANSNIIS